MKAIARRFLWVAAYAIAMALLEAVVVAYLRALIQVTEDAVALGPYLAIETWREVGTLVMLAAVGWLAGHKATDRLAYGAFAFGLWDIAYYAWLKVLLGWPASLLDWDILFLLPLRWWGPVLAPVLIALLVCAGALLAVVRAGQGRPPAITQARVGALAAGGLLALYVFMADSLHALLGGRSDWATLRPTSFPWPLFLIALALMAGSGLAMAWPYPHRASPPSPVMDDAWKQQDFTPAQPRPRSGGGETTEVGCTGGLCPPHPQ